jgi:hypothetical protein
MRTYTFICGVEIDDHPPLERWPDKALILGACPKCGTTQLHTDEVTARVLNAREIARWYRPGSAQTEEEM